MTAQVSSCLNIRTKIKYVEIRVIFTQINIRSEYFSSKVKYSITFGTTVVRRHDAPSDGIYHMVVQKP